MGYGLGASSAAALNVAAGKRSIAMMGDGGYCCCWCFHYGC
jgi:indolepyruvate ferredoxin oxidoreductase alpha subunit